MDFIDKAWRKQTRIELKLVYFVFWKIKIRFLFGLLAVSLFAYAVSVGSYFIFVKKENLFTTGLIPVVLNPIHVVFICIFIFIVSIIDKNKQY